MEYDLTTDELERLEDGETLEIGEHNVGRGDISDGMHCIFAPETGTALRSGDTRTWTQGDRDLTLLYSGDESDEEYEPSFDPYGQNHIVTCMSEIDGSKRLAHLWRVSLRDDFKTVTCFIGDVNYLVNTGHVDKHHEDVVVDEGINSWDDLPAEIQDELSKRLDEGEL